MITVPCNVYDNYNSEKNKILFMTCRYEGIKTRHIFKIAYKRGLKMSS